MLSTFIKPANVTFFIFTISFINSAFSAKVDDEFRRYLEQRCLFDQPSVTDESNFILCNNLFPVGAGFPISGKNSISIGGSVNRDSPTGLRNTVNQMQLSSYSSSSSSSSSAGDNIGNIGLLITVLSEETERRATTLENGTTSDNSGLLIGTDYKLSDKILAGIIVGRLKNKSSIGNSESNINISSDNVTVYGIWAITDKLAFDFYYGNIDSNINSKRNVSVTTPATTINGQVNSITASSQKTYGVSLAYDWYIKDIATSIYAGFDTSNSKTDAYNEMGNTSATGFELSYPEQESDIETTSIGLKASYLLQQNWGLLLPNIEVLFSSVDSGSSNTIDLRLASAPSSSPSFTVTQDKPDSSYINTNIGIVGIVNNGLQWFANYDVRTGDDILDVSAFNIGMIYKFD